MSLPNAVELQALPPRGLVHRVKFPSVAGKAVKKSTRKHHQSNIKNSSNFTEVKFLPTFSIYHAIKNVTQQHTGGKKNGKR